jgi:hypothetical protein
MHTDINAVERKMNENITVTYIQCMYNWTRV